MSIDPTITFGALLNALVLLIGFTVAFTKIGGRIDLLSLRLAAVEEAFNRQRGESERIAIMETRQVTHGQMIVAVQEDIRDMKRGRGFIQSRGGDPDGGLDGQYP